MADIVYWVDGENACTLCVDDGERAAAEYAAEYGPDDDQGPTPVYSWDSSDGESVISCDVCRGAFCAVCGTEMDASDGDRRGPWWECWNCHTTHAYLDGVGYCYADDDREQLTVGWTGTANRVIPLQYRVPTARLVATAGIEYLTIDAVLDGGHGAAWRVITYGPFGNAVLVIGGNELDALEVRDEWLCDRWDEDQVSSYVDGAPWAPTDDDETHPALSDADPCRVFLVAASERDAIAYSGTARTVPREGRHTAV